MWKLNQVIQCQTCPWRQDSKTKDIPHYSLECHRETEATIAYKMPEEQLSDLSSQKAMLCHYSNPNSEQLYCIGWLHNQLGVGNNIKLRLAFMTCKNGNEIQVIGEQVKSFKDTFK